MPTKQYVCSSIQHSTAVQNENVCFEHLLCAHAQYQRWIKVVQCNIWSGSKHNMKCDFHFQVQEQDLVSKQFSFQSSLFVRLHSLSSFSVQKIILLFKMQNHHQPPPATTICVLYSMYYIWCASVHPFTISLWFVLLIVKLKSSLIFILCMHTTRASRASPKTCFNILAIAVVVVVLFSHHIFHSIKFIFFSSVCDPWLKLVWCVHSTYKPDLIFIFVDKLVNSGWPVKLGIMKTTRQTNEIKKKWKKKSMKFRKNYIRTK